MASLRRVKDYFRLCLRGFLVKKFKKLLITLSLLTLAPFSMADQSTQNTPNMQALLQKDISQFNIPGAALSIAYPDGSVKTYVAGQSDIQEKQAMKSSQLFDIGSMTKVFTAVAVLELVNQKKLALDENLNSVAMSYPKSNLAQLVHDYPHLKMITIRELMDHTSGIANGLNSPVFTAAFTKDPSKKWQPSEALKMALSQPELFAPGAPGQFSYNNEEYVLLGEISEAVTQQSINQALSDLFKKMGMNQTYAPNTTSSPFSSQLLSQLTHTYFAPDQGGHSPSMMALYEKGPKVLLPGDSPELGYDATDLLVHRIYADFPAGGVLSSAGDVAAWYRDLFIGKVLPMSLVRQMLITVPVNSAMIEEYLVGVPPYNGFNSPSYGLGVMKQYLPQYQLWVYYHGGREPGYSGVNVYIPKYHVAFALLTNLENDYTAMAAAEFTSDVVGEIVHQSKK